MEKTSHKIKKLDNNKKYKLKSILDIIMTLDYSDTSSSSDENFKNDNTFNTNSIDSEYTSEGKEIITPSPKQRMINARNKGQRFSRRHVTTNNPNNVEYGKHESLDTTTTQKIPPRQHHKPITEDQHTKLIGIKTNFEKSLQISTGTQLQHDGIQYQEDVITIST